MGANYCIQEVEKQVSDSVTATGRLIRMIRVFVSIFKKPDAAVLFDGVCRLIVNRIEFDVADDRFLRNSLITDSKLPMSWWRSRRASGSIAFPDPGPFFYLR